MLKGYIKKVTNLWEILLIIIIIIIIISFFKADFYITFL